jgi:L-amino acid N-acyltransferase YncA
VNGPKEMNYNIRQAADKDKNDLADIFNHYIKKSHAAFFDKRVTPDFFKKLQDIVYGNSFYVLENEESRQVIGFGLLKQYHPSEVFSGVAELGYFLKPEFTNRGLGTLMLNTLISDARKMKIKTLLASISSLNEESIHFHKKHGFFECGRFKDIGQKHGKSFDVVWMQKFI